MAQAGTAYVDIEGRTDDLQSQILDALANIDATVTPEADPSGLTAEIEDAIASADGTVTVEADVDGAQTEIDSIEGGDAAVAISAEGVEQAQDQVDQLTDSTTKLGDAAQGALGGMGGLGGAAGGAASGLGATAVAGAGAAAGLFSFAQAAIDAESASQRFDLVTGDLGERLARIDVGGLSGEIGDLALQLGSSDEAMLNATASFVTFAESTGASDDQIVETSDNINALALRAVALNPALGDAGAVAERMTNALARGGRATTQFGIGLTAAEINARAMSNTGKTNTAELTQFEKAAAGAEIAVERLGNTMGEDFAEGSENARTEWNRMMESLGEAQEQLGGTMLPAIENITEAVTEMASGIANLDPGSLLAGMWDISGPGLFINGVTDAWNALSGGDEAIEGTGTLLSDSLPAALRTSAEGTEEFAAAAGMAKDEIDGLSNSITGYLDGAFALPEAQRNVRAAFDDLFAVLLTEGHTADDVAAALERVAYTTGDLGAASGNFAVAADISIGRLRAMRDAGQITEAQFDLIRDAIRGAQDQAPLSVPVSTPGAPEANRQVDDLYAGLKVTGSAHATPRVSVVTERAQFDRLIRDLDAADNRRFAMQVSVNTIGGPRAAGGPVEAGVTYPVGEEGVELFTPTSAGFITPNHAIEAAIPALAGGDRGGEVLQPVILTLNDREVGQAMIPVIRDLEREDR